VHHHNPGRRPDAMRRVDARRNRCAFEVEGCLAHLNRMDVVVGNPSRGARVGDAPQQRGGAQVVLCERVQRQSKQEQQHRPPDEPARLVEWTATLPGNGGHRDGGRLCVSDFEDDRHDQRPPRGVLHYEAFEVLADLLLDHAVVALLFVTGGFQSTHHGLASLVEETVLACTGSEPAHHNFGRTLHLAGQLVNRDDWQHDAVLAEVPAVANDEVFDHVAHGVGIDADAADSNATRLARAQFVELQYVAALDHHYFPNGAVHGARHLGVQLELPVLAVDGNEVLRLYQVDDELQLLLTGVSTDVHRRRRPIVVDDVRIAAEEMVNHAENRLLVSRNDARREHNRVSRLNARVLVVVHSGTRQGRHGLSLGAADEHANFLGRQIADLRGMDQQPLGNV